MDPHIVTIFRNRLNPDHLQEYYATSETMHELASHQPGFIDAKTFTSPDGERVTIVTFADRESHDAWRRHAEHRDAQRRGRSEFYAEFSLTVAEVVKVTAFHRD
jgi:heme-degrading monooxygenase HmoA